MVDRGAEKHKQSCGAVSGGENATHLSTGGNANTTCTQGGSVIDDVMNVICTDKNGKFTDLKFDPETVPVAIEADDLNNRNNTKATL